MSAIDDLTPMPDQPEISEGNQTFHQKAYALYKWLREKLAPAIIEVRNLIVNAVTGAFTSTSSTSFAIDTGDISIIIGTGRSFVPGTSIRAAYVTDPTKYVDGIVKTYNSGTGALVFAGQTTSGTGTYADWSISIIASSGTFASLIANKFTGLQTWANEVTVASATTIDLTAAGSNQFKLTGTVPIEGATMPQGAVIKCRAAAATPLINSISFNVQGGANYACTPGDWLEFKKDADGNIHVSISRIVENINLINDSSQASTSDVKPATPAWIKALLNLFVKFSKEYISLEQTITSAGTLTLAHGLGVEPKFFSAKLICKTNDNGFSANQKLPINIAINSELSDQGVAVYIDDTTNIRVKFGSASSVFRVISSATGASVSLTNTSWRLVISAWGA